MFSLTIKNPTEKEIQNSILEWLAWQRIFAWQNDSVGIWDAEKRCYRKRRGSYVRKGVSDILGVLPGGRSLAIEVKSKTGKLSAEQADFLSKFNCCGGVGIVARSIDDVRRGLELAGCLPTTNHAL